MPYLENYHSDVMDFGLKTRKLVDFSGSPSVDLGANANVVAVLNVKNFGAACDGVTDDAPAINAAITRANTTYTLSGGGMTEVYTPGNNRIDSTIIPQNGAWLQGPGMYAKGIISKPNGGFSLISAVSNHSVPDNPLTDFILSDIQLDGTNFNPAIQSKGFDGHGMKNVKVFRVYCHDTTATGLGFDYPYGAVTFTENLVTSCGFTNKRTITAASWSGSAITITTSAAHGYALNSKIVVSGMTPAGYNGIYNVSSVTNANTFIINTSNNPGTLQLPNNPGTATAFGNTSDSIIGHNGIGIASGGLPEESLIVTNNVCIGNQNNNYLLEANDATTGANASYIFANNISVRAGVCGFRNSFTINAQFTNNYDYGSLIGGKIETFQNVPTITAASWSGNVATYTTSAAHNITTGTYVTIQSMTPSGYNGYYYVTSTPTSTTFTVANTVNPGTATVFGKATFVTHPTDGTKWIGNEFWANTLYGMNVDSYSEGYELHKNTVADCINHGMYIQSGNGDITGNFVHDNGMDGIYFFSSANFIPMDHTDISSNHVYNNSKRTANTRDGIRIESNASGPISNLTVHNNHLYDNQNTHTQRYGALIKSGGSNSNIDIAGNSFSGNATSPILNQDTTSTSISIHNNPGYNPVGQSSISVTASPFTYTNGTSPADVFINSGTVSAVVKGTTTLAAASPTVVHLEPNQAVVVTYSVAPTMVADVY